MKKKEFVRKRIISESTQKTINDVVFKKPLNEVSKEIQRKKNRT
jgi:hypothetical protein